MVTRTYLDQCLRDGLTARWPDTAMPIKVHLSPFRWYEQEKQRESSAYNGMVMEALDTWSNISNGKVRFKVVNQLLESQINIKWRRVDRKSLGHCEYLVNDRSMIYSAEIQIGISDGLVHARYNDTDEVRHTILHEIGHALGLVGHSNHPDDIMYVPHQYDVASLSPRDIETLRWLYNLPVAFNYQAIGKKHQLEEPFTIHEVIETIAGTPNPQRTVKKAPPPKEQPEVLGNHHQILSQMGQFYVSTQNIALPTDLKKAFLEEKRRGKHKPDPKNPPG